MGFRTRHGTFLHSCRKYRASHNSIAAGIVLAFTIFLQPVVTDSSPPELKVSSFTAATPAVSRGPRLILRCETADTEEQCSEGIYSPSCEWASTTGTCIAVDCVAFPAKCKKIIFYNRVPKTGSRSMTAAMEVAAERSEAFWTQPEDVWKQYQWFGYTFKGRYVLNAAYRWNKPQVDEDVENYCNFFTKLGTQAPGVYVLHCPFLDFPTICPDAAHQKLNSTYVYINQLRDPASRLVSHLLFRQSCVCDTKMPRCRSQSQQWEKDNQGMSKEMYCGWQANSLIPDAITTDDKGNLNIYTTYFCGLSGEVGSRFYCGYNPSSPEALRIAKVNMQRRFAWVGILEEPTLSYETFSATLPTFVGPGLFDTPGHVVHPGDAHDPNAPKDRSVLAPKTAQALKEHLSNDYKLYKYAVELLHHRSIKLNPARKKPHPPPPSLLVDL